jgi:hypothetical protein
MTLLAHYQRARAALSETTRIDQVLPLLSEVEHVKLYARQIRDRELLADANEFQLRAERRLGEVIAAAKQAGHFRDGRPKKNRSREERFATVARQATGASCRRDGEQHVVLGDSARPAAFDFSCFRHCLRRPRLGGSSDKSGRAAG